MGKHHKVVGQPPKAGLPLRNKVVAAVVAGGAFAAVGQPLTASADTQPEKENGPDSRALRAAVTGTLTSPAAVRLLGAEPVRDSLAETHKLQKSQAIEADRAAKEEAARKASEARKAAEEARKAEMARSFVKPAEGTFTSGFGSRWGTGHYGIDIANSIGTPIKSVAAGEVIDAGPASGFGLWVRVRHADGTITVYGHVNTILVSVGEKVGAGEQIATMGNRGQSTGPHLHFEVQVNGTKINPLPWLEKRGIQVQ